MEVALLLYRMWAVCGFIGSWPLQVVDGDDLPRELAQCAARARVQAAVSHASCAREGALAFLRGSQVDAAVPPRESKMDMAMALLLGPRTSNTHVGRALPRRGTKSGIKSGTK